MDFDFSDEEKAFVAEVEHQLITDLLDLPRASMQNLLQPSV